MGILPLKLVGIGLIFCAGLAGGLACRYVSASRRSARLLAVGSAFTGGIFLGAGLIHLLGDSQEMFSRALPDSEYPIALLVVGVGFLLVLLIEKVALAGKEASDLIGTQQLYPWLLLVVLSVHSVIAGISLGLEQTLAASVVLFLAIIAHKGAAAFALGIRSTKPTAP